MSGVESMLSREFPPGFVNYYNLTTSGAVLYETSDLAAAIGRAGFAQAINNNAYTDDITAMWPPALRAKVAERAVGFKDDSQNTSEFSLGANLLIKRYPAPDSFELTFTEGCSLFTSNVDRHGGQMVATPPVLNILQHRRSVLRQMNNYSDVQRAAAHVTESFMALMGQDTATVFNFGTQKSAKQNKDVVVMAQSAAALRYEQSLISGTGNVMQLSASSAEDFAQKNNYFGALIKLEPSMRGSDPMCAVTIKGFGEKREANLFGRPRTNDFCYYLVRKWPRTGQFMTAAMCGGEFSGLRQSDLLQVRGFSTNDMPHTLSGIDQQIEYSDTFYWDRECEMAVQHKSEIEWDPEAGTFKERVAEDRADALERVSQIVYDAYLTGGKIYPVGQCKERFPVVDSYEQQLAATQSPDEYNRLQRIFIYNLERHYK